jgi:acyl dehydratase
VTPGAGDRLPDLERAITLTDMIAYAGATWDWHRLHYDPAYLAAKGLPAPVVDGQLFGALLVQQAQDWLGPQAMVRRLHFRFRELVFAGETVRCVAEVARVAQESGDTVLHLDARVEIVDRDATAVAPAGLEVVVRG